MAVKLRHDIGFKGPIVVSGPHGYKTPMIPDRRKKSNTVIFAGSFEKNRSLDELMNNSPKLNFNIYGGSSGEGGIKVFLDKHKNGDIKGKFDPDAIIMSLKGSYGLVWDSLKYPNVVGGKGLYEILNTPHKFSMYLAAEIPVIVWSRMGLANYVIENNIGWVIDDLSQLQELVLNITEEDYQEKLNNLEKIGGLIRSGIQFKKSIFEVVSAVNEISLYEESNYDIDPVPELGINQWIIDMDINELKEVHLPDEVLEYYRKNLYPDDSQYMKAKNILKKIRYI
ncbi:hypothetical protein [Companilactobacillus sp. DQM5]|uniref:hypothetical protein n=1 Tax=Companilactobacillus sp. DQM5 TaxID=3463359 RepID=UPI004059884E